MSPAQLALRRAEARLLERLEQIEPELGTDAARWQEYGQLAAALAAVSRETAPGAGGRLLSTAELADRLGVSSRTILRRRKAGQLEAVQLGQRGRAALRWPGEAAR